MESASFRAYGLNFVSELLFNNLFSDYGEPDISIRYGFVPEVLALPRDAGVLYQINENQFLLKLEGIARYLVQGGREIIIDRMQGASDDVIRLFLLGSCLGALLHQRGILALHASAVKTEQGAVLFTGASGNGKSTLLASLVRRGYKMLADDITGIVRDESGRPIALPGYPQIKIWGDAAERLGVAKEDLCRLRPGFEKFSISSECRFSAVPEPLHAVYALHTHNERDVRIETLEGKARFAAIRQNTYRERFLDGLGMRPVHFRLAAAVAAAARFSRIFRPKHLFVADEIADRLEKDWV